MSKGNKKIRLVVDCQLLQTNDRKRGMGFYFTSLLSATINLRSTQDVEWVFLLNSRLPEISVEDKALTESFKGSLVYTELLSKKDTDLFTNAEEANRSSIDAVIAPWLDDQHTETVFFIPAMFSSEIYPVFPSRGSSNLMLFYDIIPFLYHEHYFQDPEGTARKDYSQRFTEFYKTDLFMAISQTTADDLNIYFGVDHSRIVTVLGAGADRSVLKPVRPKIADHFPGNYILMPSGDDYRKNNVAAVKAFDLAGGEAKLVLTSNFSKSSKKELLSLCTRVVFTGDVKDAEYLWLVDHAKAVLFPSEYEGLGMPLLEAVERNVPVACSNIPVFAEINQDAFFFFDPQSIDSISSTIKTVLSCTEAELDQKRQFYSSIKEQFSWPVTAKLFMDSVMSVKPAGQKQKLAVLCPSPSSYSAVGKYIFEVHAELSRYYDIDYYVESGHTSNQSTRPNILEYAANYFPVADFNPNKAKQYDEVLYQIGNSEFHSQTILNSLRMSANAVIHDTRLNGIFDYMANRGIITKERRNFEDVLDSVFKPKDTKCLVSISNNQKVIFCHSEYAKKSISSNLVSEKPKIRSVIHPIGTPVVQTPRSQSNLIVSFAGIISESKGISLVSRISELGSLQVKVFGFGVLGDSPLLNEAGPNVEVIKDLTDKEFQDMLRRTDILVNYRVNYHGETSRSTLEAMRHGAAVIVNKIGWFDEVPDDTVVKVDNEAEALEAVRRLTEDPEFRTTIANNARMFLTKEYSFGRYARSIKEGLEHDG